MNDRVNTQTMTGNVSTTTMTNGENLTADRAKAAVNHLILRRQERMMSIAVGVGLFLDTLATTAVLFLEKYGCLIFRDGGRHQIVIDEGRIDLGIFLENLDRVRSFAVETEDASYTVIVTIVLLAALMVGMVIQRAYVAVRTWTYLSSGSPRRSILLVHVEVSGLEVVASGAFAVAEVAAHGSIAGDLSDNVKATGVHAGHAAGAYEINLWFLVLATTTAVAGVYAVAYGTFMAFVRSPGYVVEIALLVTSAAGGTLNWIFGAVDPDGSLIYMAPSKHIGTSGFPLYSILSDLVSIIFYTAMAWLCMRRIQVRH